MLYILFVNSQVNSIYRTSAPALEALKPFEGKEGCKVVGMDSREAVQLLLEIEKAKEDSLLWGKLGELFFPPKLMEKRVVEKFFSTLE